MARRARRLNASENALRKLTRHAQAPEKLPTRQGLGLDVHPMVFVLSVGLIVPLVVLSLWAPESAQATMLSFRGWVLSRFHGLFMVSVNLFVLLCLMLVLLPIGRIRLGGEACAPEFSRLSWFAMLFAAGMGIGLMFFSVAEPLAHYTDWFGTPFNAEPRTPAAADLAMSATLFHWGMHAWAIYAVMGLALAFASFNRGLPFLVRSTLHPVLGRFTWRWPGDLVDVLGVLATVFGIATSLAFGAQQAAGGIGFLSGIGHGFSIQMGVIAIIGAVAATSVVLGVRRGIRVLSNFNMGLAAILALFVLLAGPTAYLAGEFLDSLGLYFRDIFRLSNWIGREDRSWYEGWTVFYWAWWISWSPFVGMFIARVSYGRTVREFVTWALIIPTVIGVLWMSVFGGTALDQLFSDGYRGVADSVPELALFKMLEGLPFTNIVSTISVFLIAIFFITSADSGALVMDMITAGGKMDAPVAQRVFWCVLAGMVAMALMLGGGMASLQSMTISIGLPFGIVLVLMCVGLYRGLREEL